MENTKALEMSIKDIKSSTDLMKKIKFELGTVTITDLQGQKHMVDGYVGECFFAYAADLKAQLADAQAQLAAVCAAGQEVVNRWDSPSWNWDDEHTGWKVKRLREAIQSARQPKEGA